jgi:hypothetical protein
MSETAAAATRLLRLLQHLPRAQHAVAYGSGVFHQPDLYGPGDGPGPMIDFILAADDAVQWHAQVRRAAQRKAAQAARRRRRRPCTAERRPLDHGPGRRRTSSKTPATTRSWSGWARQQ